MMKKLKNFTNIYQFVKLYNQKIKGKLMQVWKSPYMFVFI